jgi:hypothetical protein
MKLIDDNGFGINYGDKIMEILIFIQRKDRAWENSWTVLKIGSSSR